MPPRSWTIRTTLLTAVLGCVLAAGVRCSRASDSTGNTNVIAVTTQTAKVTTLRDVVALSGTVIPLAAADFVVIAPEPCTIAEITKNEGDHVQSGDILVRLDVPSIAAEVATRRLELGEATTAAERAKAEADRLKGLFDKGLAARVQWEAARAVQSTADTNLVQVRAHVDTAKALEESTVIRSRFAGVVSKRWHFTGDSVAGGDSDPILRIVDPSRLQIAAQIPVVDGTRILAGQNATVQTVTGPEAAVVALKVTPASPTAPNMEVRLNFLGPSMLPIDTAVQVEIVVDERKDVVAIPADAIQRADGETFVWVPTENNQATRRDVRIGLIVGSVAQIISGLGPGEPVIVTGLSELSEGVSITISKG